MQKFLSMRAWDICWNFICTKQSINIRRVIFPPFEFFSEFLNVIYYESFNALSCETTWKTKKETEDKIETYLREMNRENFRWKELYPNHLQRRTFVLTASKFRVFLPYRFHHTVNGTLENLCNLYENWTMV